MIHVRDVILNFYINSSFLEGMEQYCIDSSSFNLI